MTRSNPPHRETTSRPLSQLLAAVTLAVLLIAQPWVVCAPLCLLNGHAKFTMAASQSPDHVMRCHSDKVIQSERPTMQSPGSMLPTRWVLVLPSARVVTLDPGLSTPIHLQQIPSADPPPPRPA